MASLSKLQMHEEISRLAIEYAVAMDLDRDPNYDQPMTMAAAALIAEKAVGADVGFIWETFPAVAAARRRVPATTVATRENRDEPLGFSITRNRVVMRPD